MIANRLIPVLLLKNGLIVRSQAFTVHQVIGNPIDTVRRLSGWNVDELIILDISDDDYHDMRRDDLHVRYKGNTSIDVLKEISKTCFMPLSFGGGIKNIKDVQDRLSRGADKCVINTEAIKNPNFIQSLAKTFGSQCIVVSIDVMRVNDKLEVYSHGGKIPTGLHPVDWAVNAERMGAGEILLNSIDRDGSGSGYDLDLISQVSDAVSVPVIACGGVGTYQHFPDAIIKSGAHAVAAANIFNFFELAYPIAKQTCIDLGIFMRPAKVSSPLFSREPVYGERDNINRYNEHYNHEVHISDANHGLVSNKVKWCTICVTPSSSATPIEFDKNGVCTACQMSSIKNSISEEDWNEKKDMLIEIFEKSRKYNQSKYDCIIPVSGGKDSSFQVHYIKNVLGYNPLLVTYYGNNFSEVGRRNLYRMKETFGVDHLIYYPSVDILKKLNRAAFVTLGDMNWHNHVGIATVPMQVAVDKGIPLVIWGEHGYADLSGQFSQNDLVEWTYRNRVEHYARGFEWNYFVGLEGITSEDMNIWKYPSDEEIFKLNLRGLHMNNYTKWEANEHTQLVIDKYNWETSDKAFDRTYRTMSNLDDIHENGLHDYLKYIKFGYGRCTDHASKDVRAGIMSRDEAISMVKKYDSVKPSDLERWLKYTGMTEKEFDSVADSFRDSRVWSIKDGVWQKDCIWKDGELFERVNLPIKAQKKYKLD